MMGDRARAKERGEGEERLKEMQEKVPKALKEKNIRKE